MEAGGRFYRLLVSPKPDGTVLTFDDENRATKETYSNGLVRDFSYTSNQTAISSSNGITVTYNLNNFGEVTEYKHQNGENNKDYSYTYDSNGNITSISLNGNLQQTFTYNSSNELVRVDDAVLNKTVTYDYDYVGNITSVKTYIYTTGTLGTPLTTQNYTYNSQNQRTDLGYDANGNLTSLNGYTFGWTNRRLTSATSTDNSISYTYNYDGIRTSKTINGITTYYVVDENNNVVKQYELVNDVETNVIEFVYESNGSPIYFTYNNATYYYEKNLQGDIVGILDANGNTVVEYTYDIWGKLLGITGELADTVGVTNPLRYRGYYYDTETGLYYLQSRYYSPDLMRFISQDDVKLSNTQGQPLGSNLYAYCLNNPVMFIDRTGHYVGTLTLSYYYIAVLSSALSGIITSISSSIAAIKAAIVSSWIPAVCIAATAVAVVGITYTIKKVSDLSATASSTVSAVKSRVKAGGVNPKKLGNYTVYVITRKNTTDVVYVGITKRYPSRKSAHSKRFPSSKYTMLPIATGLSKSQARAMEQTIITAYGIDTLKNLINSISPKKWSNFKTEFEQMQTLIQSWKDPE